MKGSEDLWLEFFRSLLVSFKVIFPTQNFREFSLNYLKCLVKIWVVGKRYQIFWGRDFIISFWIWPFCGFMRRPEWSWRRMLPFDVDLKTYEETGIVRIKPAGKREENRSITWWGEASVAQKIDFPRGPIFSRRFKGQRIFFWSFLATPRPPFAAATVYGQNPTDWNCF